MKALSAYLRVPFVRRGALLLVVLAACLALVQTMWRAPLAQEYAARKAQFATLQTEAAQLRLRIDSISTYDARRAQLERVAERFQAPVDRSGVVERLTALSSRAGTRIIHGANSFGRARGTVVPVEQDLTIEGNYRAVSRFLTDLQTLDTLTLLRQAELTSNPDGTLVRAQIKLVTLSAEAGG